MSRFIWRLVVRPLALSVGLLVAVGGSLPVREARAQVPDWVDGDKEWAPQQTTYRGTPLNLLLMFVSEQPADLADDQGEYQTPWVRVYALKDYYDMARLLELYPHLRLTIVLRPALLDQIGEMVAAYDRSRGRWQPGTPLAGCDRWLRLSLTPVEKMSREDRLFVVENFFRVPGRQVESYYGGLRRLVAARGTGAQAGSAEVLSRLGDAGLRDLVAWFNLAIFDPDFLAGKVTLAGGETVDLVPLVRKGQGYTDQDIAAIVDAQFKVLRALVPLYRQLRASGRLELATAPYDDAVLPLLLNPAIAREGSPTLALPEAAPALAADAKAQLALSRKEFQSVFGDPAPGIWLGAGGAETAVASLVAREGFAWIAADQFALRATTRPERPRIGEKRRYSLYEIKAEGRTLPVLFQDPRLTGDFPETYASRPWLKAANIFMVRLAQEQVKQSGASERLVVPVILPLDSGWETFEKDGKDFLHSVYHQVDNCPWVTAVTPTSFLATNPKRTPLAKLSATIPATGLYSRWIGTDAQNAAWRELGRARQALESARKAGLAAAAAAAADRLVLRAEGRELLAALGEKGAGAEAADRSLRDLLSHAYRAMARPVPAELAAPLASAPRKAKTP